MLNKKFTELLNLILQEKPEKSDAIIWLHGDRLDRAPKVLELYLEKWSDKIVITGNNVLIGIGPRFEENNMSIEEMADWLVKNKVSKSDIIIDYLGINTRDQSKNMIGMAMENNWKKILLVGSTYHQPRAFLTFLKAKKYFSWDGKIINQPAIVPDDQIPDGRIKTSKAYMEEEFLKIEKYRDDVAPIDVGISYISNLLKS